MSKRKADRKFMCGACHKRFATEESARGHCRDAHRIRGAEVFVRLGPWPQRDDDSSIADQMVEAHIQRAMGEPVEDWLADMIAP